MKTVAQLCNHDFSKGDFRLQNADGVEYVEKEDGTILTRTIVQPSFVNHDSQPKEQPAKDRDEPTLTEEQLNSIVESAVEACYEFFRERTVPCEGEVTLSSVDTIDADDATIVGASGFCQFELHEVAEMEQLLDPLTDDINHAIVTAYNKIEKSK